MQSILREPLAAETLGAARACFCPERSKIEGRSEAVLARVNALMIQKSSMLLYPISGPTRRPYRLCE